MKSAAPRAATVGLTPPEADMSGEAPLEARADAVTVAARGAADDQRWCRNCGAYHTQLRWTRKEGRLSE